VRFRLRLQKIIFDAHSCFQLARTTGCLKILSRFDGASSNTNFPFKSNKSNKPNLELIDNSFFFNRKPKTEN